MTFILAIDTSSEYCSVALNFGSDIISRAELAPRQHAQRLMPLIQELMSEAEVGLSRLDAIAFGRGPGSFTGLRIAAGATQGIAYGLGCPVLPISNLAAMALLALEQGNSPHVLAAVDARMDEIYWAQYRAQPSPRQCMPLLMGEEHVTRPESVLLASERDVQEITGVGSGFNFASRMPAQVQTVLSQIDTGMYPLAEPICRLALAAYSYNLGISAHEASPTYIRNEVAWQKLPGRG